MLAEKFEIDWTVKLFDAFEKWDDFKEKEIENLLNDQFWNACDSNGLLFQEPSDYAEISSLFSMIDIEVLSVISQSTRILLALRSDYVLIATSNVVVQWR